MANLKQLILKTAGDEEIEAVVIGKRKNIRPAYMGKILTWDEAKEYLDYEFENDSYGKSDECHAVYAWTASKVIALCGYDGKTWPYWIPRNPIAVEPFIEGNE